MLIELKNLENMPVGSFAEQTLLGKVDSAIISAEEAKLLGVVVKIGGWFPKYKVVSMQDIVDIDQNGVAVRSEDSLVDEDEIVRIAKIIKQKFNLIGLHAKNQKNQNLGRISNALFEVQSGDIMRIYVNNLFQERIFERSRIVKIEPDKIVIKDNP